MTGELSLTGAWNGVFTYPRQDGSVSFAVTLVESGGRFNGTSVEPCSLKGCPLETHSATLAGVREESAVEFTKLYDTAVRGYGTVQYEGRLNDDRTEISGRWTNRSSSGTFLMTRSRGNKAVAERRAFERA